MSESENTPRVWVGCLACYNDGLLVGEWFDAADCPQDREEFDAAVTVPATHFPGSNHEELWVFDHECIPVSGEFSPMDAQKYATWLEDLGGSEHGAFNAFLKMTDEPFSDESVSDFREAYAGAYESDRDFAQELADDLGFKQPSEWPYSCIDWDHAATELMYDYDSRDGYYFRNAY